jgi:cold shock CspA family protein
MVGRIQRWNPKFGYGWLGIGEGIGHFFFLRSGLQDTAIEEGDVVDFWLHDNPNGTGGLIAAEITRRVCDVTKNLAPLALESEKTNGEAPINYRQFQRGHDEVRHGCR